MSAEETLSLVLEHYGVGACQAITKIQRGHVNEIWHIRTAGGEFILKRRHPNLSQIDVVIAQHSLLEFLHNKGFPVPAIFKSKQKTTFVSVDKEIFELQEYVTGSLCDRVRPTHIFSSADTLGQYHKLVESFDHPALHRLKRRYDPQDLQQKVKQLIADWPEPLTANQREITNQLKHHAVQLCSQLEELDQLPQLIIHGDYYAGNIAMENESVMAVYDFDHAYWDSRIQEVTEAVIYFSQELKTRFKYIVYSGRSDLDILERFLLAYCDNISLTDDEIQALPYLMRLTWISAALVPPLRPKVKLNDIKALQEVLDLANWAEMHTNDIIQIGHSIQQRGGVR